MIIRQHVTEFHLLQRSYVDEKRWVGGDGNVHGMQIIPYKSKESPSLMSTRGKIDDQFWRNFGQRS